MHARGLLSNIDLRKYENWNRYDSAPWPASKWAVSPNTSTRVTDTQGGRGRLWGSSTLRATSTLPDLANADVKLDYEFSDRSAGSDLRLHLRGSGASSPTSGVTNAYRLDIDSDSTTVKLKKLVNGTASTLAEYDYNPDALAGPDPGRHSVRFVVHNSSIKVRLWPACSAAPKCARFGEPGIWQIQVDDTAVSAPGKLQVTHYYDGGVGPRAVYFDNLFLSVPAGAPVVAFGSGDGHSSTPYQWDLGAPQGKREKYEVCDVSEVGMTCWYRGETRFNAWVHLDGRKTTRLEVRLEVLDGPDLRVYFNVECKEKWNNSLRSCGQHRNWDTVATGRDWSYNWANSQDLNGIYLPENRDYKLYFTSRVNSGDESGWTVVNPTYETGWIKCEGSLCKFQ